MTARDPDGVTDRLLRAIEEQSRSTASIVELHRQNNIQLELIRTATVTQISILEKITEKFALMDQDRDRAVADVKQHIDHISEERDSWWRKVIVVLGISIIASNLIGVAVSRFIEIIQGGK